MTKKVKDPRQRREAFVNVPIWWAEQAMQATRSPQAFVCIWLLYLSWQAKSMTFPLPNGRLAERGVDRRVKRRALANLEKAGLIVVERRSRKTPVVSLVCK